MTERREISRRLLLRSAGLGAVSAGVGAAAFQLAGGRSPDDTGVTVAAGARGATTGTDGHQAGIADPAPAHLLFAAFDVIATGREAVAALLRRWSEIAAGLTAAPGIDTGAAIAVRAAASPVTVTVGLGPDLFDDRFGLTDRRPSEFTALPVFAGDRLNAATSGGDLMLQVCGEDPVAVHAALRLLTTPAAGVARLRWAQRGFGAAAADRTRATPRNLLGQKDGTANPVPGTARFDAAVWVPPDAEPAWLHSGTYLVVRKIRLAIEAWDATPRVEQERVIGRTLSDGGPLSGGAEHAAPDFGGRAADGSLAIAADSHVRLSNPAFHRGAAMFRRGYSYDDGPDRDGRPDAGLFFIAFVRDITTQFIPVQQRLAEADALNRFATTVASAVFVVPPAAVAGGYVAEGLFT